MASIQSLGLHEPSALSYLIAESILPPDPPPSTYQWSTQLSSDGKTSVVEEILTTSACAVWSRHGAIKRVFNLDIEGEQISQAFITRFASESQTPNDRSNASLSRGAGQLAFVVILKTQAHVFLLSGDIHVLPLSFEVSKAFPLARGFILQRTLPHHTSESSVPTRTPDQAAPLSTSSLPIPALGTQLEPLSHSTNTPYTFSFTELLSEIGVVVAGNARKPEPLDSCNMLSNNEEIIYTSAGNELSEAQSSHFAPLYLAVTCNPGNSSLTLWQLTFNESLEPQRKSRKPTPPTRVTRRKSSNVYGMQTGIKTPAARGPGTFRESFGGLAQSMAENAPFQTSREQISKHADDLAAQLGHEFEQSGVQTRSARRVSSMLARTDLGGANDRTTFNDLNFGLIGRKSLRRSMRHGESLGGFSDRQSFGRRRSSFQAASSMISDGTSFLDQPASKLLEDGFGVDASGLEDDFLEQDASRKPREVGFMKLKSISYQFRQGTARISSHLDIVTILAPDKSTADERRSRILSVCIVDRTANGMTIVDVVVKPQIASSKSANTLTEHSLKVVELHRGQAIVDACKLTDGSVQRLLTLTRTRDGLSLLHLEAPWSSAYRIEPPPQYRVFGNPALPYVDTPGKRRDTGIGRIIPGSDVQITRFLSCESLDEVTFLDAQGRQHRIRLRMLPSDALVRQVLDVSNFVLPPEYTDSLLVAWWEVKQWLEMQQIEFVSDWTSLVVMLFTLAVPFISTLQSQGLTGSRRKKGGMLRSSSGTAIDLEHWDQMNQVDANLTGQIWMEASAWSWAATDTRAEKPATTSITNHKRSISSDVKGEAKQDTFLVRCINLAQEFLQSPAGENTMGPEGYLPTAVNKDRGTRRTALASLLIGLHLIREERKLNTTIIAYNSKTSIDLALIIAQIGTWLQWPDWQASEGTYYNTEIAAPENWMIHGSVIDSLDVHAQPFSPPSIFQYVAERIGLVDVPEFPSLLDLVSQSRKITKTHPLWKTANELTPRLFALTRFLQRLKKGTSHRQVLEQMLVYGIGEASLYTLPDGVAAYLHQAIFTIRANPPSSWSSELRNLVGRADLYAQGIVSDSRRGPGHVQQSHVALRDYRTIGTNAIEAETVSRWDASSEFDRQTITKLIFREDRRFQEASKLVNQTRPPTVECNNELGWSEADLLEAQKELAQHVSRRTLSVAAGRAIMHYSSRVPLLTERVPIPAFTPQCVIKLRNGGDSTQPMTFSADKALFTEEKTCWAFFHNGASAGLMISKEARWIDTSWILYNKPNELTNRHAGFLLALGLNGHLKSLAKWVAFKYLTPKHTMTSIGLLIGLAASYLGTADTPITRLLSVHVTRLLPPGAAELNLSPLTQTAGLLGIGLLYYNSQHRRMSEVMLSEIESNELEERAGDEPILQDEGYRLAAGFSLGLINLGQGSRLHGLHDMGVVERLLTIAIGTKNVNLVHVLDRATAGAVIALAFIFMKTNDKAIAAKVDVPDTMHQFDYVRPDIFLLRTLARHLIMWKDIRSSQNFIRQSLPPFFQKRADLSTIRRLSTDDLPFFNILTGICFAVALRHAGSHNLETRDLLIAYLDQFRRLSKLPALNYDSRVTLNGIRNCLDVLALSCATVMAGSGDVVVMRRLRALHGRTDPETPFGSHLAAHMALGTLFLSGGTATFGTSNLAIASLVIAFYPVFPTDILDNRGHLQALRHLWVLAVENRCLTARDVETGQIIGGVEAEISFKNSTTRMVRLPALLPDLDTVTRIRLENDSYWPVDIALSAPAGSLGSGPKSGLASNLASNPPQHRLSHDLVATTVREELKSDPRRLTVSLLRREAHERPQSSVFMSEIQALDASRGVPSINPHASVNERWKQPLSSSNEQPNKNPFEWVFQILAFNPLDHAERHLVMDTMSSMAASGSNGIDHNNNQTKAKGIDDPLEESNKLGRKLLATTIVDTRLEFEMSCLGLDRDLLLNNNNNNKDGRDKLQPSFLPDRRLSKDKLWQLRLLLAWSDRLDDDDEEEQEERQRSDAVGDAITNTTTTAAAAASAPQWIKKEVVERLRWRVWKMSGGGNGGADDTTVHHEEDSSDRDTDRDTDSGGGSEEGKGEEDDDDDSASDGE